MKIAVRMDDITPDMDWESFRFFQRLFEEAGITPLLGIVPQNRDEALRVSEAREDFWAWMAKLSAQGYCLAMHGCYHVYTTGKGGLFPLNDRSEFAGLSYERQRELLAIGKEKLREQGIETDIFMAPAHSYDKNTLRALRELGFTKITDGFGRAPYRRCGLTFYPISFLLDKSLRQKKGATTMVIHANTATEADRRRYERIFREHRGDLISYGDYLSLPALRRGMIGEASEYLLAVVKRLLVRCRKGAKSASAGR